MMIGTMIAIGAGLAGGGLILWHLATWRTPATDLPDPETQDDFGPAIRRWSEILDRTERFSR